MKLLLLLILYLVGDMTADITRNRKRICPQFICYKGGLVLGPDGCLRCLDSLNKLFCYLPKCKPGCAIGKLPGELCPICICKGRTIARLQHSGDFKSYSDEKWEESSRNDDNWPNNRKTQMGSAKGNSKSRRKGKKKSNTTSKKVVCPYRCKRR